MRSYINVGKLLKRKREEHGYSQASLSRTLGNVHHQVISSWERGIYGPPNHSIQRLIELLEIDRAELVTAMLKDSEIYLRRLVFGKKGK